MASSKKYNTPKGEQTHQSTALEKPNKSRYTVRCGHLTNHPLQMTNEQVVRTILCAVASRTREGRRGFRECKKLIIPLA